MGSIGTQDLPTFAPALLPTMLIPQRTWASGPARVRRRQAGFGCYDQAMASCGATTELHEEPLGRMLFLAEGKIGSIRWTICLCT